MTAAEKIDRKLDPDGWYNTEQIAQILQCSRIKLEIMRQKGDGIPFKKFGKQVRYRGSDVINYLESRTRTNTAEY